MLKQANFRILCLFYVLVKLMNGQEVQLINLFWNVEHLFDHTNSKNSRSAHIVLNAQQFNVLHG